MSVGADPPPPLPPIDVLDGTNTDAAVASIINDPPPPYPSRDRRNRTQRSTSGRQPNINSIHRIQTTPLNHDQYPSTEFHQHDRISPISSCLHTDDDIEPPLATETTLLLTPTTRRSAGGGRPRSYSHASTLSAAPSLARTVLGCFQTSDDEGQHMMNDNEDRSLLSPQDEPHHRRTPTEGGDVESRGFFSAGAWRRYFRPLATKAYYSSLLHLALINFPYALAAWVYLFVFTVTGTTLLVALPLGAVLCFFNLLGARTFSRGELYLQYRFHYPLSYPPPYPPRPVFTRYRQATISEIESGHVRASRGLVRETSFYKNAFAMFTDSTSYQALFYFLVIKPAITLLLTIAIWAFALPLLVLVLPAPAVLRAVRRFGIWQANVAIEGLYLAVR